MFAPSFMCAVIAAPIRPRGLRPRPPPPSSESELLIESMRPNTRAARLGRGGRRRKEEAEPKVGEARREKRECAMEWIGDPAAAIQPVTLSYAASASALALDARSRKVKGWRPRTRRRRTTRPSC